jgi:hypothetical protein
MNGSLFVFDASEDPWNEILASFNLLVVLKATNFPTKIPC